MIPNNIPHVGIYAFQKGFKNHRGHIDNGGKLIVTDHGRPAFMIIPVPEEYRVEIVPPEKPVDKNWSLLETWQKEYVRLSHDLGKLAHHIIIVEDTEKQRLKDKYKILVKECKEARLKVIELKCKKAGLCNAV